MELIVRGSEYQSFLDCRKEWYYAWVEKIEPKRPDGKLFFGTVGHKFLEHYYLSKCDFTKSMNITQGFIRASDLSAMTNEEIEDMKNLFAGVSNYYHTVYGESDKAWNILGTEVEFLVRLDGDLYYTGTIDLVYELDGKVRFADHKTVSSLDMYEQKSRMDRQISRYWWVLKQLAAGVGLIKSKETGEWVPWLSIQGKEIDGFDYNLIAKDYPKEPRVLKSGKVSTDKSQKTTAALFDKKIEELGLNPHDYDDFRQMLLQKPDQWLRRIDVKRNDAELESAMWEFMYTTRDIHDVKLVLAHHPDNIEEVTYRNIGQKCQNMCNYRSLCQTEIEGGNVSMVRNLGYKKKEEQ